MATDTSVSERRYDQMRTDRQVRKALRDKSVQAIAVKAAQMTPSEAERLLRSSLTDRHDTKAARLILHDLRQIQRTGKSTTALDGIPELGEAVETPENKVALAAAAAGKTMSPAQRESWILAQGGDAATAKLANDIGRMQATRVFVEEGIFSTAAEIRDDTGEARLTIDRKVKGNKEVGTFMSDPTGKQSPVLALHIDPTNMGARAWEKNHPANGKQVEGGRVLPVASGAPDLGL